MGKETEKQVREIDENGVELTEIRENLRLTPLERIRKADAARRRALESASNEAHDDTRDVYEKPSG
jgi:hypothetical protein